MNPQPSTAASQHWIPLILTLLDQIFHLLFLPLLRVLAQLEENPLFYMKPWRIQNGLIGGYRQWAETQDALGCRTFGENLGRL